jgi:hypothetical protein
MVGMETPGAGFSLGWLHQRRDRAARQSQPISDAHDRILELWQISPETARI